MIAWRTTKFTIAAADDPVPRVMGIVNVTPDSFSDGGRLSSAQQACERARSLVARGADLLDFGGESSRPGAEPVTLEEELRRTIPAIELAAKAVNVPISIDTTKAEVARQALAAGASIVNDISALTADPQMIDVVAESGAAVVLMHMRGTPATMQMDLRYDDVVSEVLFFLRQQLQWLESRGIARERIAVDPGVGFGKSHEHNMLLLKNIERFTELGCTVLVGASRKGFLGKITGRPIEQRDSGTAVASLAACVGGARVVRVHDVATMVDTIKIWQSVRGWESRS
jgi:dihydropteroate synthase